MSFFGLSQPVTPAKQEEAKKEASKPKKLVLLDKSGKRITLRKPSKKHLVDKDRVFNVNTNMPKIANHPSDSQVYKFTRLLKSEALITTSTSLDTTATYTFLLSALPGVTDLTSLFDAYRIVAMEVWFIPRFSTNTDRSYNPGMFCTVVDYDGGTNNYDELAQFPNAMISSGLDGHYRAWAPAVIMLTPGPSSAAIVTSPWLDCADTGVAHHGLCIGVTPTSQVQTYDRVVRYHIEFKRVR